MKHFLLFSCLFLFFPLTLFAQTSGTVIVESVNSEQVSCHVMPDIMFGKYGATFTLRHNVDGSGYKAFAAGLKINDTKYQAKMRVGLIFRKDAQVSSLLTTNYLRIPFRSGETTTIIDWALPISRQYKINEYWIVKNETEIGGVVRGGVQTTFLKLYQCDPVINVAPMLIFYKPLKVDWSSGVRISCWYGFRMMGKLDKNQTGINATVWF